jgi:hypothetical protein
VQYCIEKEKERVRCFEKYGGLEKTHSYVFGAWQLPVLVVFLSTSLSDPTIFGSWLNSPAVPRVKILT